MARSLGKESDFLNSSQTATIPDSDKPKKSKSKSKSVASSKTELQIKFENSPWYREQKDWAKRIKKHRYDLRHAKPMVDDRAPHLDLYCVYDVETLKGIQSGLTNDFYRNLQMVKILHKVNVFGGRTETLHPPVGKKYSTNYKFRKETAKFLEVQNQHMKKRINDAKPKVTTVKEYAEQWEKTLSVMENSAGFPLYWKVEQEEAVKEIPPPDHYVKQYVTEKSVKYPDKRPRVFLEVSIKNGGVVGRMTAVLYSDYVPMTVKNFLAFIDPKSELTYKGNLFYLIFPNYYCQTGDVVENKGYGGTSIYGPYFGNEDFTLKHSERGILTMYSKMPNRNASQFLITFRKLESLDGQNVVFGKIIKGFHVLNAIEGVGSMKGGRPKVEMYISDCDEI